MITRPVCEAGATSRGTTNMSWPVVELRRYTLHLDKRDTLIELFDRELVETQEACGMDVIAQFRDIDHPNMFTWLRGFADMGSRAAALTAFYDGPAWAAHRDAANATMIDSDNVRLLHPRSPAAGFEPAGIARPERNATRLPSGLTVVTIYTLAPHATASFADFFDRIIAPDMAASGARPCATFETEESANTFPRLPVREDEHAFVWFAQFDDVTAYDRHIATLAASHEWNGRKRRLLERQLCAPGERWRLVPTARSLPLVYSARQYSPDQGPLRKGDR
jgi:quinol monooxygenase YgiN